MDGAIAYRVSCGLVGVGRSARMAYSGFFHSTVCVVAARRYLLPFSLCPDLVGFLLVYLGDISLSLEL